MLALIPALVLAWSWDDLSLRSLSSEQVWSLALGGIPFVLVALAFIGVLLAMRPRHPRPH